MHILKINSQICIYSLADLNTGHCVELTLLEDKLGEFLVMKNLDMN